MIKAICIEKIRNKNNVITSYVLKDTDGKTVNMPPDKVKLMMQTNQLDVINLKLTSDNRLISVEAPKQKEKKTDTTETVKDTSRDKVIAKAKMLGLSIVILRTPNNEKCYLMTQNEKSHILYFPDTITERFDIHDYSETMENIRGKVRVIGGKHITSIKDYLCNTLLDEVDFSGFIAERINNVKGLFEKCNINAIDVSNINFHPNVRLDHMLDNSDIRKIKATNLKQFDITGIIESRSLYNVEEIHLNSKLYIEAAKQTINYIIDKSKCKINIKKVDEKHTHLNITTCSDTDKDSGKVIINKTLDDGKALGYLVKLAYAVDYIPLVNHHLERNTEDLKIYAYNMYEDSDKLNKLEFKIVGDPEYLELVSKFEISSYDSTESDEADDCYSLKLALRKKGEVVMDNLPVYEALEFIDDIETDVDDANRICKDRVDEELEYIGWAREIHQKAEEKFDAMRKHFKEKGVDIDIHCIVCDEGNEGEVDVYGYQYTPTFVGLNTIFYTDSISKSIAYGKHLNIFEMGDCFTGDETEAVHFINTIGNLASKLEPGSTIKIVVDENDADKNVDGNTWVHYPEKVKLLVNGELKEISIITSIDNSVEDLDNFNF